MEKYIYQKEKYIYIIFSQHANTPIEICHTGSIKGFSTDINQAKQLAKELVQKENIEDAVDVHSVVVRYTEGLLDSAIWSLNQKHFVVAGYVCKNKICHYNLNIPVDDLNQRVLSSEASYLNKWFQSLRFLSIFR